MLMTKGGTAVEKGLYWDPMDGRRITLRENGILPGDGSQNYMKISSAGLLILAPLFGMMYVIFLPLLGIGVFLVSWLVPLIGTLAEAAITGVKVCGRINGRSSFFNWNPTRAYFHGFRKKAKSTGRDSVSPSNTKKGGK
jgi:hypothetical protein